MVLLEACGSDSLSEVVLTTVCRLEDKGEKVSKACQRVGIREDCRDTHQHSLLSNCHDKIDLESFRTDIQLECVSCFDHQGIGIRIRGNQEGLSGRGITRLCLRSIG